MTHDEFRRYLAGLGATFKEGTRHTKVHLDGRTSFLPRHGSREIPTGTVRAIKRQLGIKD